MQPHKCVACINVHVETPRIADSSDLFFEKRGELNTGRRAGFSERCVSMTTVFYCTEMRYGFNAHIELNFSAWYDAPQIYMAACVRFCVCMFNPCSCDSSAHLFFAEVTVNSQNCRERPPAPAVVAGMSSHTAAAKVPTEAKSAAGSDLFVTLQQSVIAADVAGASVEVPEPVNAESDAKQVQQQRMFRQKMHQCRRSNQGSTRGRSVSTNSVM